MNLKRIKLWGALGLLSATQFVGMAYANGAKKPQIHIYESDGNGFHTKTFFYESEKEVIAIDAQFTEKYALEAIQFLKTKTDKPIKYLLVTHPNPDKFNGASEFQKVGAKVVASQSTVDHIPAVHSYKKTYFIGAGVFTEETYPKVSVVDEVFETTKELNLSNGEKLLLTEWKQAGVSTNQTTIYSPQLKTLFVGDLIHSQVHSWLEGGVIEGAVKPTISSWKNLLSQIQQKYPVDTFVYGGRGLSGNLGALVAEQTQYLEKAQEIVQKYISQNKEKIISDGAQSRAQHYAKVSKLIQEAYPKCQFAFMLDYGIYGLFNSEFDKH